MASAAFHTVVCWGGRSRERDRKRLDKLFKRAISVLDCPLDSIEEMYDRMLAKLSSVIYNTSHPLLETVGALSGPLSTRLLQPQCEEER